MSVCKQFYKANKKKNQNKGNFFNFKISPLRILSLTHDPIVEKVNHSKLPLA